MINEVRSPVPLSCASVTSSEERRNVCSLHLKKTQQPTKHNAVVHLPKVPVSYIYCSACFRAQPHVDDDRETINFNKL